MFSVGSIGAIGRGSARSLDTLWRIAGFTPSFDFPFARNRSLVDAVTGQSLIAYTQASSGTYVNSNRVIRTAASNEPRFDHDPATGESLGLLGEGQMSNLLIWSEDSSQWLTPTNATPTQNAGLAPDGNITADRILETTTSGLHLQASSLFPFELGVTYTYSVFVKTINGRNFEIGFPSIIFANRFARFNLATGAVQGTDLGVTALVFSYPEGWYWCIATSVCNQAGSARVVHFINDSAFARIYTGETDKGLFHWGAMLNAGSLPPSSYIPTAAEAVTRSASLADLISSAIANNIRSFYCEFRSPAIGARGVVSLNDDTANNRAAVITSGTDPRLVVHSGGVEQANVNGGTVTAGARTRVAVRINNNDFAISINGGAVVTDTSGTLPIVNRIMIGRTQAGEFLNDRIARFTGWNQLLSDATLRSLSSQ